MRHDDALLITFSSTMQYLYSDAEIFYGERYQYQRTKDIGRIVISSQRK